MPRSRLRADLTPLRTARDFRLLYVSRTVIALGTQATEVALLVQAKQLTGSTVAVGLLGAVELVPLVVFGLYGGVLADRFDRRRLILVCEAALGCCAALLMLNALATHPLVWPLYVVTGLAPDIAVALGCLVLAGAADMTSGIFRDTLWNQTIPDRLRGRMAGLELLSYGVGPPAGQIRAGAVASVTSARFSLASGGLFCAGAVGLVCLLLPGFTRYRAQVRAPAEGGGQ